MKRFIPFILLGLTIVGVLIYGAVPRFVEQEPPTQDVIAENIARSSPMYAFDGSNLRFVETVESVCCTEYTFFFESTYLGYGAKKMRGELIVAPTPHTVIVEMDADTPKSVIVDYVWDEQSQEFVS